MRNAFTSPSPFTDCAIAKTGSQRDNKMDSDSGLPDSPIEAEDSFTRRLQAQKGPRGQTPSHLNRALLEPGSTSAQLEAVEELARQAEGILARRLDRHQTNQHRDEEDGFEFTAELADFPRSPSVFSEQQVSETVDFKTYPDRLAEQKTALKSTKSLDVYQKYSSASSSMRRYSVGASTAEKYRLSYVDISDSDEEESGCLKPVSTIDPVCHSESTTLDRGVENDLVTENELHFNRCRDVVHYLKVANEGPRLLRSVEVASVENLSAGQLADLQYDDDELAHTQSPIIHKQTAVFPRCHSCKETHHKPIGNNVLMSADVKMELLAPFPNTTATKSDSETWKKVTQDKNHGKRPNSSSAAVRAKENAPVKQSTVCMDHAAFSPLYNMTATQLQYVIQLLEAKLQGNHSRQM